MFETFCSWPLVQTGQWSESGKPSSNTSKLGCMWWCPKTLQWRSLCNFQPKTSPNVVEKAASKSGSLPLIFWIHFLAFWSKWAVKCYQSPQNSITHYSEIKKTKFGTRKFCTEVMYWLDEQAMKYWQNIWLFCDIFENFLPEKRPDRFQNFWKSAWWSIEALQFFGWIQIFQRQSSVVGFLSVWKSSATCLFPQFLRTKFLLEEIPGLRLGHQAHTG